MLLITTPVALSIYHPSLVSPRLLLALLQALAPASGAVSSVRYCVVTSTELLSDNTSKAAGMQSARQS